MPSESGAPYAFKSRGSPFSATFSPSVLPTYGYDTVKELTQQASRQALHELNQSLEQQVTAQIQERDRLWRNTQDVQLIVDGQGVLQAVSPAFTAILGWSTDDVRGRNGLDFIRPDEEASQSALDHARTGNLPVFENRYRHKEGGFRWFLWVATKTVIVPKYVDQITGNTWTGRGPRPAWLSEALSVGTLAENLLVS